MNATLASIINGWQESLLWIALFFVTFPVLARFMPCNAGQPRQWRIFFNDCLYSLLLPIATRFVRIFLFGTLMALVFFGLEQDELHNYIRHGHGWLASWPLWLQAAAVFILSDIILYWTHRWFHSAKMWRWHAIHHSPKHVEWHSTYRFHPVNIWLSFTLVDILMVVVGFSPEAIVIMAAFNTVYSAMVHANLNWTFGPLRYVFASPVFHRWHHTSQKEGMDKNFAPTFPLIDIIFGTFYMPDGKRPERYGVHGADIPESFLGQMLWPFKQK